jgi:hypothetical protein
VSDPTGVRRHRKGGAATGFTAYGFFDVSDVAVFGLAGAPKSDFCSGAFLGASFSHPTPTHAKIATAIIARKIRINVSP